MFVKAKQHLKDHRVTYFACAGTALVTAGGVILFYRKGAPLVANTQKITGLSWKPTQKMEVWIEALGDPGNIIQDMTTGTIYASQNQAAKALGLNASRLSQHLSGKVDNVEGYVFEKLGKAQVSQ